MLATKVTLRQRSISKDRFSLYLDFYPPIKKGNGKTSRRESLKIYLKKNPKTEFEKEQNKESLVLGEMIASKKQIELHRKYYLVNDSTKRNTIFSAEEIAEIEKAILIQISNGAGKLEELETALLKLRIYLK